MAYTKDPDYYTRGVGAIASRDRSRVRTNFTAARQRDLALRDAKMARAARLGGRGMFRPSGLGGPTVTPVATLAPMAMRPRMIVTVQNGGGTGLVHATPLPLPSPGGGGMQNGGGTGLVHATPLPRPPALPLPGTVVPGLLPGTVMPAPLPLPSGGGGGGGGGGGSSDSGIVVSAPSSSTYTPVDPGGDLDVSAPLVVTPDAPVGLVAKFSAMPTGTKVAIGAAAAAALYILTRKR